MTEAAMFQGTVNGMPIGWLPITTAPKDGRFVLLFSPDSDGDPFIGQWRDHAEYPDGGAWWEREGSGFAIDADPSHWMPLPAPPKTEG